MTRKLKLGWDIPNDEYVLDGYELKRAITKNGSLIRWMIPPDDKQGIHTYLTFHPKFSLMCRSFLEESYIEHHIEDKNLYPIKWTFINHG